jgi:hypothetical protein
VFISYARIVHKTELYTQQFCKDCVPDTVVAPGMSLTNHTLSWTWKCGVSFILRRQVRDTSFELLVQTTGGNELCFGEIAERSS